jgi:predicted RNA binding protein YcfA (HicA-like mRNA interferase family)
MPTKIRELKTLIKKAGFELLVGRGKGSHTLWQHSQLPEDPLVIPGKDGDDAHAILKRKWKEC